MSDFPATIQEAKDHIQQIRINNGLDRPDPERYKPLESALGILSDQLYQKSTHFLLELIQNADDNTFESSIPTLNIEFKDRCLFFSCNEVGFTRSNVEAICNIGLSTKSGSVDASQFTGEKGIGFKSVFKVADVAWIRSGKYSFKFDRSEKLGMITPIWADPPFETTPGFTSIVLSLSKSCAVDDLIRGIKQIDAPEADITLAFPMMEEGLTWQADSQNVYSYLPIRDFGFKFLLHSDFILTASREDIDQSSEWNRAICQALPTVFSQAVQLLNQCSLRYSWLQFFPVTSSTSSCFEAVEETAIKALTTQPIFESFNGTLSLPSDLICVPLRFQDDQGFPLTSHHAVEGRYLSQRYQESDWPMIQKLGVEEMSPDDFLDDLFSLVTNAGTEYRQKPAQWHSCLARSLTALISSHPGLTARIFDLPLVPLRNGRWITGHAAKRGKAVLPFDNGLTVPPGIQFTEVDPTACDSDHRKCLFFMMDIRRMSPETVCDEISKTHTDARFDPAEVPLPDLVSQVRFMYQSKWRNPVREELWFVTDSGTFRRGSQLYLDSTRPYAATRFFQRMRRSFGFLNTDYLTWAGEEEREQLVDWLVDNFYLSAVPKLAYYTVEKAFSMTREFEYILQHFQTPEVLMLLRTYWSDYRYWIAPEEAKRHYGAMREVSRKFLIHRFSSLPVVSRGGKMTQLCHTALPIPRFVEDKSLDVDFIDLPNPESEEWEFLRLFNVLVGTINTMNLSGTLIEPHVTRLQAMRHESHPVIANVAEEYRKIQFLETKERRFIRTAFTTQPLIYIPPSADCSLHGWFRSETCRWSGAECLRKTPQVSAAYPDLSDFFCVTLQMKDADLTSISDEVLQICPSDGLKYISKLFTAFSRHLATNEAFISSRKGLKRRLFTTPIFPIITQSAAFHLEFDRLQTAQDTDMWFIADRPHLKKCFEGIVPILAIESTDVAEMSLFLDTLELKDRMLSGIASGQPQAHGEVSMDEEFTRTLRRKARFISRLLPEIFPRRKDVINMLHSMVVYEAERITMEWSIKTHAGESIPGRSDSSSIKIHATDDSLTIYTTRGQTASKSCSIELVEFLSMFCEIREPEKVMMLQYILMESDLQRITEELDRRGFSEITACPIPELPRTDDLPKQGYSSSTSQPPLSTKDYEVLQSFLNDVEKAKSVQNITSRRWERNAVAELKPFLSRICRLERQDVSAFLPQSEIDSILGGSDNTNDKHEVAYFTNGLLTEEERHSSTSVFFPAIVAVPKRGKPKFRVLKPAVNLLDPEVVFLGELHFSQMLEKHMGGTYRPQEEWTSRLRARAGFRPCTFNDDSISSTFTIQDRGGSFTRLLTRNGYRGAIRWAVQRTFHIDLITIEGNLRDADFCLHPHQLEIARRCYVESMRLERPSSISVLAIVFNIRSNPGIALFVDPWRLYLTGYLDIVIESHSLARFQELPEHILLRDPEKRHSYRASQSSFVGEGKFVYQHLTGFNEFRLLQLYPGRPEESLRGSLSVHPISSRPQYSALSYCWGVNLKPYKLTTPDGTLEITASCDSALRSLRERDRPVFIWVDAICINQNNNHEKANQIRLIRDIYQNADMVYGCVGDDLDGSHLAIETLLQIRTQELEPDKWPSDLPSIPLSWAGRRIPPPKSPVWDSIDAFFARDWFKRVWITQEIVLASDVMVVCGLQRARWSHLIQGLEVSLREAQALVENSKLEPGSILQTTGPAFALAKTRKLYSEGPLKRKHDLLTLFELFSHTRATLERDKMFGLLGLAADADETTLTPDYESSFEAVVRRFAATFVSRGSTMSLLYRSGDSKSYDFSSWIPAWTRNNYPRTISTWYSTTGSFCASGNTGVYASVSRNDPRLLTVSGTFVDSVSVVGEATLRDSDMWTFVNSLYTLIESMVTYPTGESLENVKVMLPIGNASRPALEKPDDLRLGEEASNQQDESFEWAKTTSKFSSIQALLDFFRQPNEVRASLWKYWQTVSTFSLRLSYARFFASDRGYAGLVPSGTQKGDKIVLLHGGAVPFVVRPLDSLKGAYRLIGECYVHGMMHGEGLEFSNLREEMINML
ncbi:hypothetical protein ACJZ2D_014924 [Fusarium nematophilum]